MRMQAGITHTPWVTAASHMAKVSPACLPYTHAKNQLLKWKYSCLLGPQIKMHMADDNTNRAALRPSIPMWAWPGQAVAAAAAVAAEAPF